MADGRDTGERSGGDGDRRGGSPGGGSDGDPGEARGSTSRRSGSEEGVRRAGTGGPGSGTGTGGSGVGPEAGRSPELPDGNPGISRRSLLRAGAFGAVGLAAARGALGLQGGDARQPAAGDGGEAAGSAQMAMTSPGELETAELDPAEILTDFDYGDVSTLPSGQTLREYRIVAVDRRIEVAPGVHFAAWTYNGRVPGPTIRCTEGDRIRIHFSNAGSHPHTLHFHGIHPAEMDGVFEIVEPGESFVYEFDAEPWGLHLYHCHAIPLKRHIHKGLYGTFIVDPKDVELPPAKEMVMVMNGFDTNFDGDNEVYAVNTGAFHFQKHPIELEVGELNRIYLVNVTEFDPINSFHLHANFFRLYPTHTSRDRWEYTDTAMFCQGERAVLEFTYDHPGRYMFHAHQSEFAELGWMGIFDVKEAPRA